MQSYEEIVSKAELLGLRGRPWLICLLLAMCEVGLDIKAASADDQLEWAVGSILANEKRYQKYIKQTLPCTPLDFIDFMYMCGGPMATGYTSKAGWNVLIKQKLEEIQNGFSKVDELGEGNERHSETKKENRSKTS